MVLIAPDDDRVKNKRLGERWARRVSAHDNDTLTVLQEIPDDLGTQPLKLRDERR